MSRLGRIVVPGLPHHVTQRGNRRQRVLFKEGGFALYRDILAERCRRAGGFINARARWTGHLFRGVAGAARLTAATRPD